MEKFIFNGLGLNSIDVSEVTTGSP